MASPTPLRTRDGTIDVYSEPMLYMTAWAAARALSTIGFAAMRISWP